MTDIFELGAKMSAAAKAVTEAFAAMAEAGKPVDVRTDEVKTQEAKLAKVMMREHLAAKISEVLADHTPRTSTHWRNSDQSLRIVCHHEGDPHGDFPDERGWRDHVSLEIARRLMKDE